MTTQKRLFYHLFAILLLCAAVLCPVPAHARTRADAFNNNLLWFATKNRAGAFEFTPNDDEYEVRAKSSTYIYVWSKGFSHNSLRWADTEYVKGEVKYTVTYHYGYQNGREITSNLAAPGYQYASSCDSVINPGRPKHCIHYINTTKSGQYQISIQPASSATAGETILTFKDDFNNTYKVKMNYTPSPPSSSSSSSSSSNNNSSKPSTTTPSNSSSSTSTNQIKPLTTPSSGSSSSSNSYTPNYYYPSSNNTHTSNNVASDSGASTNIANPYQTVAGLEFDPAKLSPEYASSLLEAGKCYPIETQAGYFLPLVEDQILCLRTVLGNIGTATHLSINTTHNPRQPITSAMWREIYSAHIQTVSISYGDLGKTQFSFQLPISDSMSDYYSYLEQGTNNIFGEHFTDDIDMWFRFTDQHDALPTGLELYLTLDDEHDVYDDYDVYYFDHANNQLIKITTVAKAKDGPAMLKISLDATPPDATTFEYIIKPARSITESNSDAANEAIPSETTLSNQNKSQTPVIIITVLITLSAVGSLAGCAAGWKKLHRRKLAKTPQPQQDTKTTKKSKPHKKTPKKRHSPQN